MGWVNLSVEIEIGEPADANVLVEDLIRRIDRSMTQIGGQVAHVKAVLSAEGVTAIANATAAGDIDMGLCANRPVIGRGSVIINARVVTEPESLQHEIRQNLTAWSNDHGMTATVTAARALRPGRPEPTHRYPVTV